MSKVIQELEQRQLKNVPRFLPGDRVKVHFQVQEGKRTRTQIFEGIVLKRQGSGSRETFTVRKTSFGVGVQRTFPVHSPKIERIDIEARGEVNRSKLYYLRGRIGRKARVREQFDSGLEEEMSLYETELAKEEGPDGEDQVPEEDDEVAEGEVTGETEETAGEEVEPDQQDRTDATEGNGAEDKNSKSEETSSHESKD